MPTVRPIHTPAQSCSLAKVSVASVVLSLISASENDDTTESRANRGSWVLGTISSAGGALPPGPHGEYQERHRRHESHRAGRQRRAQKMADRHRDPVRQKRGDRHPGQHHPPSVAQRVGHGDELGPVAEFGKEYHSQAQQNVAASMGDLSTRRRPVPNSGRRSHPPVCHRFAGRAVRQYVDSTIGGYSPSLTVSGYGRWVRQRGAKFGTRFPIRPACELSYAARSIARMAVSG